jgi:hypothetical protein
MDNILTIKQFKAFSDGLNKKYKHFNSLYKQKISELHHNSIMLKAYMDACKHPSPAKDDFILEIKCKLWAIQGEMEFVQDEIRMYKREVMRLKDMSQRVSRAYSFVYENLSKILKDENFGKYRSYHRFEGDDIKVHVRIVNSKFSVKHTVWVNTTDKKYGKLTRYEQAF